MLAVAGPDRVAFLQGLVSNDVEKAAPDRAVHAAFLTPQGKFLFDFVLFDGGGRLLLDCEAARLADFARRLSIFRLRSRVEIADASAALRVHAAYGDGALAALGLPERAGAAAPRLGGLAAVDPRLPALGARLVLPEGADPAALGLAAGTAAEHDALRLALGVPDGSRDLEVGKTTLLESGFDELNGIDWGKGCYMGQELTARMKYRGLAKRRLMPVAVEGPLPPPGTPVAFDGRDAGQIRSGRGAAALAAIRLDRFESAAAAGRPMTAGEALVFPRKPDWAAF